MPRTKFLKAVDEFWRALGQPGDVPELAESAVDAFVDLLHLTAVQPHGFRLLDVSADPYLALAAGDPRSRWHLHWAMQVCEVEPFFSDDLPDQLFFVDTIADPDGQHRVYTLQDGVRGEIEFASIDRALLWMGAHVRRRKGELTKSEFERIESEVSSLLDDEWEDGSSSGAYLLDEFLACPLPQAWDAISRGQWPLVDTEAVEVPTDREDGWQRRLSLWVALRFLEIRRVELPDDVKASDMDAVHRSLIDHFTAFGQALEAGDVPAIILTASKSDDPLLAQLASDWIQRHDAWRTAVAVPSPEDDADEEDAPPPFQHTPFTRRLMAALDSSLDNLVALGELEFDSDRKEALLAELVAAGSDARSMKHMLKRLAATLVDSEHVEEVYASDDRIQDRFREALGG